MTDRQEMLRVLCAVAGGVFPCVVKREQARNGHDKVVLDDDEVVLTAARAAVMYAQCLLAEVDEVLEWEAIQAADEAREKEQQQ